MIRRNSLLKIIICWLFTTFTVCATNAQTVMWSVHPTYDKIEQYSIPNTFMCWNEGKCGLIDANGVEWVPVCADYTTEIFDGISLALEKTSKRGIYRVLGIIHNNDRKYISLENELYIKCYPCFSEGLLSVFDVNGNFGYIDQMGNIAIKPQFKDAHPFGSGLALVNHPKVGFMYIRKNYDSDRRPQTIKFNNGKFDNCTSFNNGEAFIKYGSKAAFINEKGEVIRKFDGDISEVLNNLDADHRIKDGNNKREKDVIHKLPIATDVQTHIDNNLYGLYFHGGTNIPAQFEEIQDFYGDYAIVKYHNKYGIIKRLSSSVITENITTDIVKEYNKKPSAIKYTFNIPNEFDAQKFDVQFKMDGHTITDVSTSRDKDGYYCYTFTPIFDIGVNWVDTEYTIIYDNIVLSQSSTKIDVTYPIRIDISNIKALSARANENDIQTIVATITNYTAIPVDVDIKIQAISQTNIDGEVTTNSKSNSNTLKLKSGVSTTINVDCHVETKFSSCVKVVVNNNNKTEATKIVYVELQPYYE